MNKFYWGYVTVVSCSLFVACPEVEEENGACTYNEQNYADGESFGSTDGCNTCQCENGSVNCTLMNCAETCLEGQEYFEPGCSSDSYLPEIEAGCYYTCNDRESECMEGTCQATTINPCLCEEGQTCCDACGQIIQLCLVTEIVTAENCKENEVFVEKACLKCGDAGGCSILGPTCRAKCIPDENSIQGDCTNGVCFDSLGYCSPGCD